MLIWEQGIVDSISCLPVIGGLGEQSTSCLISLDAESKRGNYSAIWLCVFVFPWAGLVKVVAGCKFCRSLLEPQKCSIHTNLLGYLSVCLWVNKLFWGELHQHYINLLKFNLHTSVMCKTLCVRDYGLSKERSESTRPATVAINATFAQHDSLLCKSPWLHVPFPL